MGQNASMDEMWNAIEKFGISRRMLDPHHDLPYQQVSDLYLTIKKKDAEIDKEQIRLVQEALEKEPGRKYQ